ncbi:hypothetical protein AMK68_00060 [candidate division KD3-62 bacterium DG_56]|uniref:Alpha-galactosidase n=1 Tax=candidate division KD3-62 bacterium DG_56 TaxID=1704032 RepID=A0A0S7XRE1_9BACT|nr:MAG: hypothetical protein AMK68_00060 [candidate division KD3-62 bacterium DG_56]
MQPSASGQEPDVLQGSDPPPNAIWLDSLDLSNVSQGWGVPRAGRSVDNNPLTLNGTVYQHGLGTHAHSEMIIDLRGAVAKFMSMVGVDDERVGMGSVIFQVWVDGEKKADSGIMRGGDTAKLVSVDLTGAKRLVLVVTDADEDGINNDHADWAGSLLILKWGAAAQPVSVKPAQEPPIPIASGVSPKPSINGPRIVGATPGNPFMFLIPATGEGPLTYSARNLPAGLKLNSKTGIITGSLKAAGETIVTLTVKGPRGTATRKLKIVGGMHKLALTPPLGWNSWNVWGCAVDAEKVRQAADWMVKTGLAAHGFQYINIDDCWEGGRDANGEIQTNEKFGDMKALADYVHGKGLKLGIYSSPGPKTCAGYEGTYEHEEQDARTWAKWGIDYVKYDWCSYQQVATGEGRDRLQRPYHKMREALDKCGRDIAFSLCQYGMGEVWEWGAEVGGNCWRTTGDIRDSWGSMSGIGFGQDGHERYAGPGHWNDPDMLVVGKVGWGPNLHPTKLTPNEQITHITLWCLLSSPLLIGCDMSQMDQFTIDLLSNDEVLLGKPAGRRAQEGQTEIWARPLWDGTTAVGLFNRGSFGAEVTAKWADLGLEGPQPVRDLWQNKDLGTFDGSFGAQVPAHGAVLVKIGKPNRSDW